MHLNKAMSDLLRQMYCERRTYHKDPNGMYEVRAINAGAPDEQSRRGVRATIDQTVDGLRGELEGTLRGRTGYAGLLLLSANWLDADVPADNDLYYLIHWLESGIEGNAKPADEQRGDGAIDV